VSVETAVENQSRSIEQLDDNNQLDNNKQLVNDKQLDNGKQLNKKNAALNVLRIVASVVVFVALFMFVLSKVSYVLRDKPNASVQDNFALLERDSVDVIFIGQSHQFCSINPDMLAGEYGINCFMLATSGQTVAMSYYAAMEAIELQHPKTIYMETGYVIHEWQVINDGMSHMFFDGMPKCKARKEAIDDLIEPENRIYYYLNLGQYHTRWSSLTEIDYQNYKNSPRGRFYSEVTVNNWPIPVVDRNETAPMTDSALEYMDKLVALCKENNVELILYTMPYNTLYFDYGVEEFLDDQRIYNGLYEYAQQNGLEYHNLFYEIDEIAFDYSHDFMDSQHTNCYGQDKITRYMVEKGYIR